jgi:hypothetical protein
VTVCGGCCDLSIRSKNFGSGIEAPLLDAVHLGSGGGLSTGCCSNVLKSSKSKNNLDFKAMYYVPDNFPGLFRACRISEVVERNS